MAVLDDTAPPSPLSGQGGAVGPQGTKANPLASKVTSILSSSFADLDIRNTLNTLDARSIQNTTDVRRNLRLDVQKEIIECNGDIVDDFGNVARVRPSKHG